MDTRPATRVAAAKASAAMRPGDWLVALGVGFLVIFATIASVQQPVTAQSALADYKNIGIGVLALVLLGAFALQQKAQAKREGRRTKSLIANTLPALLVLGSFLWMANWFGSHFPH